MFENYGNRVCTVFAIDFEPVVGCDVRLASAAETIQASLRAPHWGFATGGYVFRHTVERLLLAVDFRRIVFQTLGLQTWQKKLDEHVEIMMTSLHALGVNRAKRIGFVTQAYLPTGMSHGEMTELMLGSYLAPAEELEEVCGTLEDALVQLHGERDGMKLQLIAAPMTAEQVSQQFMQLPNLEAFVEPKLLDMGVKEFRDRVTAECFFVSVDLSRTDVPVAEIGRFSRQSLDWAQRTADAAVQKLKSLRVKQGR